MPFEKALFLAAALALAAQAESAKLKFGGGFGTGFGMLGAGLEAEWHNLAVLGGVGTFGVDEVSWDVGARYYVYFPPGAKVRPHVTAAYAPVYTVKYQYLPLDIKNELIIFGFTALAGIDHDFGGPGGFMMTYGGGIALPGSIPKKVKDDYAAAGEEAPKLDPTAAFSVGIKHQF